MWTQPRIMKEKLAYDLGIKERERETRRKGFSIQPCGIPIFFLHLPAFKYCLYIYTKKTFSMLKYSVSE